jgi:hypothetical protein
MHRALRLERWLGLTPAPQFIGEAAILPENGFYGLRHRDDRDADDDSLEALADLAALRRIVKTDVTGAFRPLRGAPTLRRGWRMDGLSSPALLEALDVLYPAAVAFWDARERKELQVTEFAETALRQTGMYRLTQVMTPPQLAETVRRVCSAGCLRRRLWQPSPAPDCHVHANEIPLLCPEACNYFVAQARERIVTDRETCRDEE